MATMPTDNNFHLDRQGDALILQALNGNQWFGALFGGFALFWVIGWIIQEKERGLGFWLGLVVGVTFIAVGIFLLVPRRITTIFDVRSRQVLHHISIGYGWHERRHSYTFDEIAGLGVKEYAGEGYSYLPVLILRTGKMRWLAAGNGGYLAYAKTIEDVCAATGLEKHDLAHKG
jgi:hypothetical protein